jgi:hypothetical protein
VVQVEVGVVEVVDLAAGVVAEEEHLVVGKSILNQLFF